MCTVQIILLIKVVCRGALLLHALDFIDPNHLLLEGHVPDLFPVFDARLLLFMDFFEPFRFLGFHRADIVGDWLYLGPGFKLL